MNENLDLTKILKDCPKGTKLYSLISGEVEFIRIDNSFKYPIRVKISHPEGSILDYTKEGRFFIDNPNGECLLFPSKENRDWSTFKVEKPEKEGLKFKAGDYITDGTLFFLVTGMEDGQYVLRTQRGFDPGFTPVAVDKQYDLCSPDEVATFKKSLHENGLHWSKSKNKLIHWYRPFEKVLVRYAYNSSWRCCFFSHYDKESNLFECDGGLSITDEENILPYEGNENKVGKITK